MRPTPSAVAVACERRAWTASARNLRLDNPPSCMNWMRHVLAEPRPPLSGRSRPSCCVWWCYLLVRLASWIWFPPDNPERRPQGANGPRTPPATQPLTPRPVRRRLAGERDEYGHMRHERQNRGPWLPPVVRRDLCNTRSRGLARVRRRYCRDFHASGAARSVSRCASPDARVAPRDVARRTASGARDGTCRRLTRRSDRPPSAPGRSRAAAARPPRSSAAQSGSAGGTGSPSAGWPGLERLPPG